MVYGMVNARNSRGGGMHKTKHSTASKKDDKVATRKYGQKKELVHVEDGWGSWNLITRKP